MSYQVIARKWRPQSFDEVSGQQHVTTALRNAIRSDRIPHAMLLTGPRGVGKTTLARLIARCLNCEKGPTIEPCGSCPPCTEITEGRSTDVQEIDAASRTGVDDMREVIESIRYAAAPGKHRIFIVDEVHMLSGPAFNALLKTLEEPPPKSLFIFATTNPEKIPFTVLSRCQRHDLRRIALSTVGERLTEICVSEGIEISPGAIASIAREGDGSMRDAQTLLDQIVAYASGQDGTTAITDEIVADVLDLVDGRVLRAIAEACIEGDPKSALEHVAKATSGGSEARRVADALLELLRNLVVLRVAPEGAGLFDGPDEERAELIALAGRTEPARLRRMFRALVREIEDLSWAPQPVAVLEMAVIRLATMPAGDDVGQLLARLDQLERRLAAGGAPSSSGGGSGGAGGGGRVADRGPRRRAPEPASPAGRSDPADDPAADGRDAPPAATRTAAPRASARRNGPAAGADLDSDLDVDAAFDGPAATPAEPARFAAPTPTTAEPFPDPAAPTRRPAGRPSGTAPSIGGGATNATGGGATTPTAGAPPPSIGGGAPPATLFDRFRAKALEVDRSKFASMAGATLVAIEGDTIRIGTDAAFHVERLRKRQADLEALASRLFGKPTRIHIEISAPEAAREQSQAAREQDRRRRQEALNSEPVNLAIEVLDAEIVEIRPLGGVAGPARGAAPRESARGDEA